MSKPLHIDQAIERLYALGVGVIGAGLDGNRFATHDDAFRTDSGALARRVGGNP